MYNNFTSIDTNRIPRFGKRAEWRDTNDIEDCKSPAFSELSDSFSFQKQTVDDFDFENSHKLTLESRLRFGRRVNLMTEEKSLTQLMEIDTMSEVPLYQKPIFDLEGPVQIDEVLQQEMRRMQFNPTTHFDDDVYAGER